MLHRLAADAVLLLHLGFILFVLLGAVLALRWRRAPLLHLPAAAWGVYIELSGGLCPLTPLENRLRIAAGEAGYAGGFIEHYVVALIYPAGLSSNIQYLLAAIVVVVNGVAYAWVWARVRRRKRHAPGACGPTDLRPYARPVRTPPFLYGRLSEAAEIRESGGIQMRAVWASGVLAAAMFIGVFWYLSSLKPGVIALQFAWHPQTFGGIVHLWSEDDLARYRSHLPVDYAVLLAYAAFGWLLATRTRVFAPLSAPGRLLARFWLPLAAVFDAVENAFHWWLTEMPRFDTPMTYLMSTGCSVVKWVLLIGFGALVLHALSRAKD